MRIGIPVLNGRVAPRCTIADGLLLVTMQGGRVSGAKVVPPEGDNWLEFLSQVNAQGVDTLVCGGISRDCREGLLAKDISVIENVACTTEDVLAAIAAGRLRAGYGFDRDTSGPNGKSSLLQTFAGDGALEIERSVKAADRPLDSVNGHIDCLACRERVCLLGKKCRAAAGQAVDPAALDVESMLESALDISFEAERTLCRLSELIYFGLEMKYRRVGVAYCIDLSEPTQILVGVLRRFFQVIPVCCKIGGKSLSNPDLVATDHDAGAVGSQVACNPCGQAAVLNSLGTDMNIIVGLCVGTDCVFTKASEAPVTTLFVKDKSLANNPIGALYSDYYLKEAARTPVVRT